MTMTNSPPLVSLQAPKDVSIDVIDSELRSMWQNYNITEEGLIATRATTFSFLIYEPDETQHLLADLGFYTGPIDGIAGPRTNAAIKAAQKSYGFAETGVVDDALLAKLGDEATIAKQNPKLDRHYSPDSAGGGIADAIAASNPCRIVTLCPTNKQDEGVKAQVSAYCPIQKHSKTALICCEYITLEGTSNALERIGGIVLELMLSGLPKFVWWKASPDTEYELFNKIISRCDTIIFDSCRFLSEPEVDLESLADLIQKGVNVADLNWARLAPWQELSAEAFDAPERRAALGEVDQVIIDYEKGNPTQALMYLGWIASRLQWRPISYVLEPGDYDIRRIKFIREDQRIIEAELAAIPMADYGEVVGDLISLRLSSTNPQADCCTVLCSSTTGCMRMEAGGGAQSCRIQQVTSLLDQNTEQLIGRQLQRWGQDHLYNESMSVTYQILKLAHQD